MIERASKIPGVTTLYVLGLLACGGPGAAATTQPEVIESTEPAKDPVVEALCAERPAPVMAAVSEGNWDGPFTLTGTVEGKPYEATFKELQVEIRYDGGAATTYELFSPDYEVGASAMITAAYLVDDTLFLVDTYAGPAESFLAYTALDPKPIAFISDVFGGAVSVVDDHRVAAVQSYLSSVSIYDTRTGATTKHARPIDLPCTPDETDQILMEMETLCDPNMNSMIEPSTEQCCAAAGAVLDPYAVVGNVIDLGDGTLAVRLGGKRAGDVVILDAAAGTIVRELTKPCDS